jgi:hypothetical protein
MPTQISAQAIAFTSEVYRQSFSSAGAGAMWEKA